MRAVRAVPRRTVRQEEALHRLAGHGRDPAADLTLLAEVGRVMRIVDLRTGPDGLRAVESAIARLGVLS